MSAWLGKNEEMPEEEAIPKQQIRIPAGNVIQGALEIVKDDDARAHQFLQSVHV